jgi:hypothetical protein
LLQGLSGIAQIIFPEKELISILNLFVMKTFLEEVALYQPIFHPKDNYEDPWTSQTHPSAGGEGHEGVEVLTTSYG